MAAVDSAGRRSPPGPWTAGPLRRFEGPAPVVLVRVTEAGAEALLGPGPDAVQAEARRATSPAVWRDADWRYSLVTDPPVPEDLVSSQALDTWLGRRSPDQPIPLLTRKSANRLHRVVTVPADLTWFAGHFPGAPVVPGAVQLRWWIDWVRELLPGSLVVTGISQLKFSAPVGPGSVLEGVISIEPGLATCSFASAQARHASARLQFQLR